MVTEDPQRSVPADLALRYEWQQGSLPPPYHYEYTIRIGPGAQGEIVFLPDYAQHNPPQWTEALAVTDEALAGLYRMLQDIDVFSHTWRRPERSPVGGSYDWLDVTARGQTVRVPSHLAPRDAAAIAPVYEAIRALVPKALWVRLRAQHEAYMQRYEQESGR